MLWKNVFYALLMACLNNERQLNDRWVIVFPGVFLLDVFCRSILHSH